MKHKLRRVIKEGCPLSPVLFMLFYEAFHGTLRRAFPEAAFYVYVDASAMVTNKKEDLCKILERLQRLSDISHVAISLGSDRFLPT